MISDDQLFDLMQMVKNTNGTKGAIVELDATMEAPQLF